MIHGIIKFVNYRIIPKYSDLGRALDKIPEHDCSLGSLGTLEGDKIHCQPVFFATFVQFLRNLSMLHPQELSNLHPKIHAYIIEELMKKWVFLMSLMSPKIPKLPTQFFDILINATIKHDPDQAPKLTRRRVLGRAFQTAADELRPKTSQRLLAPWGDPD